MKTQPLRTIGTPASALLIGALSFWLVHTALAQPETVTFNFDTNTPALTLGRNVPLDQTAGGVQARFSSPQGGAFSVQTDASTGYTLSQFSGHYLLPNNQNRNALDILFSQSLTNISLKFATTDFPPIETPTPILLTAYVDSTATPAIGSVSAQAAYGSDTMPMGTLTFSSAQPFNLVEIRVPVLAGGTTDFLVDNITITTIPEPGSVALTGVALGLLSLRTLAGRRRRAQVVR